MLNRIIALAVLAGAGCTLYFDGDDEGDTRPPKPPPYDPPPTTVDAGPYIPDAAVVGCALPGEPICDLIPPSCNVGETPAISNSCYTGWCTPIEYCPSPPACNQLQHEHDCLMRQMDCGAVYTGNGCHHPDGSACTAGDTNCMCNSFTFASCDTL